MTGTASLTGALAAGSVTQRKTVRLGKGMETLIGWDADPATEKHPAQHRARPHMPSDKKIGTGLMMFLGMDE